MPRTDLVEAVDAYRRDGFWIGPRLFDADTVDRLREAAVGFATGREGHGAGYGGHFARIDDGSQTGVFHVDQAWAVSDAVRACALSPEVGRIAAALIGVERVRIWGDLLLYKPPLHGDSVPGNVGWHQDKAYWACVDGLGFCTAWMSCQRTRPANGGMRWVKGSHRWGTLPASRGFFRQDMDSLRAELGHGLEWEEAACELEVGQVSFHHPLVIHGAGPNQSDDPLIGLAVHYVDAEALVRPSARQHPNFGPVAARLRDGDPLPDSAFPLLPERESAGVQA